MMSLVVVAALALSASALQTDEQLLYNSAPAGCSAALKCTPLEYCTAAGVMSDVVVDISPLKRLYSAPLTNCRLDGGRVGKCCRDPNYVDPWPVNMIGKWIPGIPGYNTTTILPVTPTTPKPIVVTGKKDDEEEFEKVTVHLQKIPLPPYDAGDQCGLPSSLAPFGNHTASEADFAQYPWQAMVLEQDGEEKSLRCGGIITRPNVVLTSAACVEGLSPEKVLIKGGEWKLGVDEEPLPFQIVQVKHILPYPFYQSGTYQHDIAILVLRKKLRFAKNINPICMPSADFPWEPHYGGADFSAANHLGYETDYGQCVMTGWGKEVLQAHRLGAVMHDLNVTLLKPDECQARINKYYPNHKQYFNKKTSVCAEPANALNNICSVDIGSALACPNKEGHYVLRAIYSWDSGCKQLGNQLGGLYKFDVKWYRWAIGESSIDPFTSDPVPREKVKMQGEGVGTKSEKIASYELQIDATPNNVNYTLPIEPKIVTYTTRPEIIAYTTRPEIIAYTTRPKIVAYAYHNEDIDDSSEPEVIDDSSEPEVVTESIAFSYPFLLSLIG